METASRLTVLLLVTALVFAQGVPASASAGEGGDAPADAGAAAGDTVAPSTGGGIEGTDAPATSGGVADAGETETGTSGGIEGTNDAEPAANGEAGEADGAAEMTPEATQAATAKPRGAITPQADTNWYKPGDTICTISSIAQMQGLAKIANDETGTYKNEDFTGKTIKFNVTGDIWMTDFPLPPIGTAKKPFAGTFDGNGATLRDLKITTPASRTYVGLFGKTATGSAIKNLNIVGGELAVAETNPNGNQIRYVGAVAGYAGGDIENCKSGMDISVSSALKLDGKRHMGIIRNVGGVAGYIAGDMRNCSNGGTVSITSASDITEDVRFLVGEIGGLAGAQGDVNDPTKAPVTEGCRNAGALTFSITGAGGKDRFGQQLYSVSFAVGGIIGQASGVVRNCTNSGIVNTSNGLETKPESGRGASNTGGVVGNLRSKSFEATNAESMTNASANDPGYDHFVKKGGASKAPGSYPTTAAVYDCANTGVVVGLAAVGGVVGTAGTFTEIEGCSNTADVKGCRWNKPFAGGVAGTTQGDVRYCYNRGDVHSVTGGGYYCTGLVSGLWSANNSLTKDNERVPVTELTGCYTTGYIFTSSAGYRTGILAGENEGYIHHNAYLPSLSLDDKIVDTDVGTVRDNEKLSPADLKGSKGRALLNTYAAGKGSWDVCYLPDKGNRNDGYPVLKRIGSDADLSVTTPTAISSDWTAKLTADAPYSASINPVPQFSVSSGGKTLLQNADFRVVPAPDAKGQDAGGAEYTATIAGIGGYKGKFSDATKTKYRITKAAIESCTIVSDAVIFNWEVQRPTKEHTRLIDEAGNEVTKAAYTVSDLYNGGDTTGKIENGVIRYYDYINAHGPNYKYDVVVTASSSAVNYTGKAVQQAFRIDWASMLPQNDPDHDKTLPERVTYGDVVWQGETWDFLKALEDTSGDTIRIPYTGDPITPTFVSATYKGLPLRLATDLDYIYHPLKYDFKYIYGNPNPELAGGASSEPVDVTPGEPTCMTARFTNGGNFDGFINIFYRIVPADIGLVTIVFPDRPYTGGAHTPTPQITYNGKELREGKDYTVSRLAYASNVSAGAATADIAIDGLGNFSGSLNRSVNFNITPLAISPAAVAIADRTYTGKAQKPKPTVTCGGVALKEGADYTLSKITYKANKAVGDATAKFTVTGAGNYAGSVEKTLTFRIRPGTAKAVKVSVGKRSMKVSFRKAPASHKVTAYEVRYRMKGTKKWRVRSCPASKSSVTVKGLKKGKRYEAQVRSVKKVKVKTGKSKKAKTTAYYGAWSAIKTSKKIR